MATMTGGNGGGSRGGKAGYVPIEIDEKNRSHFGGLGNEHDGLFLYNNYIDRDVAYQRYLMFLTTHKYTSPTTQENVFYATYNLNKMSIDNMYSYRFSTTDSMSGKKGWYELTLDQFHNTCYNKNNNKLFYVTRAGGNTVIAGYPISIWTVNTDNGLIEEKTIPITGLTPEFSHAVISNISLSMYPYLEDSDTLYVGAGVNNNSQTDSIPVIYKITNVSSSSPAIEVVYKGTQRGDWTRMGKQVFKKGNVLTFVNSDNNHTQGFIVDINLTTNETTEKPLTLPTGVAISSLINFYYFTSASSGYRVYRNQYGVYKGHIYRKDSRPTTDKSMEEPFSYFKNVDVYSETEDGVYYGTAKRATVIRDNPVFFQHTCESDTYSLYGVWSVDRVIKLYKKPNSTDDIFSSSGLYSNLSYVEGRYLDVGKLYSQTIN